MQLMMDSVSRNPLPLELTGQVAQSQTHLRLSNTEPPVLLDPKYLRRLPCSVNTCDRPLNTVRHAGSSMDSTFRRKGKLPLVCNPSSPNRCRVHRSNDHLLGCENIRGRVRSWFYVQESSLRCCVNSSLVACCSLSELASLNTSAHSPKLQLQFLNRYSVCFSD